MSIIYSYPVKSNPNSKDLLVMSDCESTPKYQTKQTQVSSLPFLPDTTVFVSSLNGLAGAVSIISSTLTIGQQGNSIKIEGGGGSGSTDPSAPFNGVQFNNSGSFGASANFTFVTDILKVTNTIELNGDGTNAGKLKLFCPNVGTPHAVTLEGPSHPATAYTLKMPAAAPSNNTFLVYDATNNLEWAEVPDSVNVFSQDTDGLVPGPDAAELNKYLKGDGTWDTVAAGGAAGTQAGAVQLTDGNGVFTTGSGNGITLFYNTGNKILELQNTVDIKSRGDESDQARLRIYNVLNTGSTTITNNESGVYSPIWYLPNADPTGTGAFLKATVGQNNILNLSWVDPGTSNWNVTDAGLSTGYVSTITSGAKQAPNAKINGYLEVIGNSSNDRYLKITNAQVWVANVNPEVSSATLTIDWAAGNIQTINLGVSGAGISPTVSFSNVKIGATYILVANQVNQGQSLNFNVNGLVWPTGSQPAMPGTNGDAAVYTFIVSNDAANINTAKIYGTQAQYT